MHNTEQIQFWNGPGGQKWVAHNSMMEAMLHDIGMRAIDMLAPEPGYKALDIGCGCGNQTLDLARRIGPAGEVIGVDISAPMLHLGQQLAQMAADELMASVSFLQADAYEHDFQESYFDVLFSRFGVMFFDDPIGAFSNLRSALKSGGRLGFVCWQSPEHNPFMTIPVSAALQYLPAPEPVPPGAPGPFAFADADRIRGILTDAGFSDIQITATPHKLYFGANQTFEDACQEILDIGPVSRLLIGVDASLKTLVFNAVSKALRPFHEADKGLGFEGGFWLVSATNPIQ